MWVNNQTADSRSLHYTMSPLETVQYGSMALSRMCRPNQRLAAIALAGASIMGACATVKVEAPDEPIEINLNVNITQEVRVKLERDVEDLIASNPDLF